jgi:endoglycosylceramidase
MKLRAKGDRILTGLALATSLGVTLLGCHSSPAPSTTIPPAPLPDASTPDASTAKTCTVPVPAAPDWRLHADGTLFRDGLGRVVLLRGVAAGGRSKFSPYVPFEYADGGFTTALDAYMDHAAKWGIDAMRVPFTWAALEPTQGQDDADWLSRYDQILDAAWARGIWTVIDFHQDVYSEVFCGDGFPGWTVPDAGPPHHDCPSWPLEYYTLDSGVPAAFDAFFAAGSPVQAAYLAAWDVMIARYKDKPGVLGFEPLNEPGWGTADEGTFAATTLTAFYSAVVPHMRAAAPSSLVFVDPPSVDASFGSTQLGRPIRDAGDDAGGDGIVFAPHYYPVSGINADFQSGLQTWANVGIAWNVPVFVGEFGASALLTDNLDYMSGIFDALDTLGLSGTEWEYSVETSLWNGETDSIVASDGGEYVIAGAVQRPFARAVAGSAITEAFDTTSNTFTLAYAPSTGVTEVSLPGGPYPTGYALTVSGACVDATSAPGRLLLQPDTGAAQVTVKITPK